MNSFSNPLFINKEEGNILNSIQLEEINDLSSLKNNYKQLYLKYKEGNKKIEKYENKIENLNEEKEELENNIETKEKNNLSNMEKFDEICKNLEEV